MATKAKGKRRVQSSRRKFLKTAGKVAIYTPPAMLAVAQPSYAHFRKSGGTTYDQRKKKTKRKYRPKRRLR